MSFVETLDQVRDYVVAAQEERDHSRMFLTGRITNIEDKLDAYHIVLKNKLSYMEQLINNMRAELGSLHNNITLPPPVTSPKIYVERSIHVFPEVSHVSVATQPKTYSSTGTDPQEIFTPPQPEPSQTARDIFYDEQNAFLEGSKSDITIKSATIAPKIPLHTRPSAHTTTSGPKKPKIITTSPPENTKPKGGVEPRPSPKTNPKITTKAKNSSLAPSANTTTTTTRTSTTGVNTKSKASKNTGTNTTITTTTDVPDLGVNDYVYMISSDGKAVKGQIIFMSQNTTKGVRNAIVLWNGESKGYELPTRVLKRDLRPIIKSPPTTKKAQQPTTARTTTTAPKNTHTNTRTPTTITTSASKTSTNWRTRTTKAPTTPMTAYKVNIPKTAPITFVPKTSLPSAPTTVAPITIVSPRPLVPIQVASLSPGRPHYYRDTSTSPLGIARISPVLSTP
ncbi:hypothetical protein FRC07_013725, partial [Ceratobasidium sp. 392]